MLDCMSGRGINLLVGAALGRRFVGYDMNPTNLEKVRSVTLEHTEISRTASSSLLSILPMHKALNAMQMIHETFATSGTWMLSMNGCVSKCIITSDLSKWVTGKKGVPPSRHESRFRSQIAARSARYIHWGGINSKRPWAGSARHLLQSLQLAVCDVLSVSMHRSRILSKGSRG